MVFLSDHCHIVATEKIRNMRTWQLRSTMYRIASDPESELGLISDARGRWELTEKRISAPDFHEISEAGIENCRPDCSGTILSTSHEKRRVVKLY